MAQFVGIDLGSYSVKLVVVDVRFRETKFRGAYEQRVATTTTESRPATPPPSPGTSGGTQKAVVLTPMAGLALATDALKQLLTTHGVKVEAGGIAALPGERVSVRHLALPFGDLRKLAKVVPFELEAQIPFDIDDVVYDHLVVSRSVNKAELLAAASPKSEVSQTLDALRSVDVDPRMLAASPMAYGPLLQRIVAAGPEAVALVDLGHVRTNVCMVKDKHVFYARCISRGGLDVTRAIARAYRSSLAEAERGKHAQAMVAPATDTFPSAQHAQVAETCRNALAPLVRDLKQSLAACRAQGQEVSRVVLCGGASQLRGIAPYLANELELPVGGLPTQWTGLGAVALEPSQALAASLALSGTAGKGQLLDLRKGPFAYHGDSSALRTRLPMLAAWAAVVIACLGVNAIASYRSLKNEGEQLDRRLERETRMLFGTPRTDAAQIAKELRSGGKEQNPIPDMTAYDVLNEISRVSPDTDKVWLDVLELDIKPRKTFIRGTADTLGHVDDVVKAMKTISCFEDVKQGRTQDVGKVKEFSLEIKTRCP